ncbi:RHS repeat-associated core domain-containing protein [Pseudomonas kurunegalensis]|uniref:RHS repeat-associated core domain-containing protein n=1 Tax=Pseudomonas kurunegalensis TaxID=485880 RepID=UPI00236478EF|nr:RHS repeat-associated core domain-containing protein [Pseudomonas kurunegalensis]MDD2135636.1 RHS repeat-associated core domain-containing protein [Pseudomonas kurunegalensis]
MLMFYQSDKPTALIHASRTTRIFNQDRQPLAIQHGSHATPVVIASDKMHSSITEARCQVLRPLSYTAFGFCHAAGELPVGFNGERCDGMTGMYGLGAGYRWFSTTIMRFSKPDNLSPFAKGGINAYTYAYNDPVNLLDLDGHAPSVPVLHGSKMRRFQHGFTKIHAFDKNYGVYESKRRLFKKPKLLVYTHGREGKIQIDGVAMDPLKFTAWLASKNIKPKKYRKVIIASCLGGYGKSFGQEFSNQNNVKVSAIPGISDAVMVDGVERGTFSFGLLSEPYKGMPEGTPQRPWAFSFVDFTPQNAKNVRSA